MLILKNLWHRRSRNGWLFAELVIVTVLLWLFLDSTIVAIHDTSLPLGYDSDRLVVMDFNAYKKGMPAWTAEGDSAEVSEMAVDNIYRMVLSHPDVENATLSDGQSVINADGLSTSVYLTGNPAVDTLVSNVMEKYVIPDTRYFETFGLQPVAGSRPADQLSLMDQKDCVVITRPVADFYWPGRNAVGQRFIKKIDRETGDTTWLTVAGVVEAARDRDYQSPGSIGFRITRLRFPASNFQVVARLRDGVNPRKAADELYRWGSKSLTGGNFYLNTVTLHSDIRNRIWQRSAGSKLALMGLLALFFMISLMLGTVGNVWLQTCKRIHEVGVLRSFGARRSDVMRMLMGESALLAFAAFVVGEIIYLQWALKFGLSKGVGLLFNSIDEPFWTNDFAIHFTVVSLAVLAVVEFCVLLGSWLPARALSRVNPVDALREE